MFINGPKPVCGKPTAARANKNVLWHFRLSRGATFSRWKPGQETAKRLLPAKHAKGREGKTTKPPRPETCGFDQSAAILLNHPQPVLETACFPCQQAAEKMLKAYLIDREIDFARVHSQPGLSDRS
jgi:hypothetical protein